MRQKKWSGKIPTTAERDVRNNRKPYTPNAKDTSLAAEKAIKSPSMPFNNDMTTAQMPAGSQAPPTYGTRGAAPGQAAVGQNRPINNSAQVNGPKGTSFPARHRPNSAPALSSGGPRANVGTQKPMGGKMNTTDPMAGQHGKRMGGAINTGAAATQKPNRKGGAAFYGE
jgi:hypothetical protein